MNTRFVSIVLLTLLLVPAVGLTQLPSTLDSYLYLSVIETALYSNDDSGDIIWFYDGDTLDGPLRSNDYISIRQRPVFLGTVYSSMDEFREFSANPYFEYEPQMQVEEFTFDFDLNEIREFAVQQSSYFSNYFNGNQVRTRLEASPTRRWLLTQWPEGTEYNNENIINSASINFGDETVIFVEGNLDIYGENISGNNTIVCSGEIRIIDNLMYAGTTIENNEVTISEGNTSTLGLIASGDILVANTDANGRGNGGNAGPSDDHRNKHCVITAALVSINGSFSFENKNFAPGSDRYDGYYWCDPEGHHSYEQDYRGVLYFLGSMAHYRRDYIRMSHCQRTGYDKWFRYDHRFEELTPPLFDNAMGIKNNPGQSNLFPVTHQLDKAYPNPFNSSFNLNMVLAKRDQVKIRLVNVFGQEVFSQNYGWMNAGNQRFEMNLAGNPAGLYFAQISTSGGFSETQKVVFLK